jgi:RNA polymerase sigma factor (sigma-70 family)
MQQHVENDGAHQKVLAETLFHRHAPALYAYLCQKSASREDAEDILLEVFLATLEHKHFSQFPSDQQQALLWRIARNKLVDAHRRTIRRPAVSLELLLNDPAVEEDESPDQELLRMEEYALLHSLVQRLSPFQQRLLHLRFVNELRSPQIASLVGKSETAVRSLISRTLNQLRKWYRERKHDE